MDKLYSISKTADILGVSQKTLRVWDKQNKLIPVLTSGGHRRYKESDINAFIGIDSISNDNKEICVIYARVSSQKQKTSGDLDRQSQRLCNISNPFWNLCFLFFFNLSHFYLVCLNCFHRSLFAEHIVVPILNCISKPLNLFNAYRRVIVVVSCKVKAVFLRKRSAVNVTI